MELLTGHMSHRTPELIVVCCSVQADTNATLSESEQVADIELGEPQQEEPAAASQAQGTLEENNTSVAEASTISSAVNGNSKDDTATSTSNGKRPSQQQESEDKDKNLPPSKRTRTAPGGAQRRLFGVLTKTLSKFQEETKKDTEAVSLNLECIVSRHRFWKRYPTCGIRCKS